jgi:hypothetical protein
MFSLVLIYLQNYSLILNRISRMNKILNLFHKFTLPELFWANKKIIMQKIKEMYIFSYFFIFYIYIYIFFAF